MPMVTYRFMNLIKTKQIIGMDPSQSSMYNKNAPTSGTAFKTAASIHVSKKNTCSKSPPTKHHWKNSPLEHSRLTPNLSPSSCCASEWCFGWVAPLPWNDWTTDRWYGSNWMCQTISKHVASWPIKEKRHQEIDAKNQHTLFWKLKLSLKNISPLDWTQFLVTTHPHSWHPSAPLVDCKLPRPDVSMSWELKHSLNTPPQSLWQLYGYVEDCMHSFGSSHHFSIHFSESKSFCGWVCMLYPQNLDPAKGLSNFE